jgi:hypothetical protein
MSDRTDFIANLRAMAQFLEDNPALPVPYSTYLTHYPQSLEEAREMRNGSFGWEKQNAKDSSFVNFVKKFGGDQFGRGTVAYELAVSKSQTCERVQVDTRHVEAVEAHDEPVYEWRCEDV